MTEPLTDGQLDPIGWRNTQGLADLVNLPAQRGQRGHLRRLHPRCSRPWAPWASASTPEPGGGRSYRGQNSSTSTTMTATITANTMAQLRATWRSSARLCSLSGSRSAYRSLPTP